MHLKSSRKVIREALLNDEIPMPIENWSDHMLAHKTLEANNRNSTLKVYVQAAHQGHGGWAPGSGLYERLYDRGLGATSWNL